LKRDIIAGKMNPAGIPSAGKSATIQPAASGV
jgi:hypothetical protein